MRKAWLPAAGIAVALGLSALTETVACAQPLPLGPQVLVDRSSSRLDDCARLAARSDGRLGFMWRRVVDTHQVTLWAITVDADGSLGPRVLLDDSAYVTAIEDLVATAGGFTALWRRAVFDSPDGQRFPHVVARLGETATPEGDAIDLGRGGIAMSGRPGGGLVSYWSMGRTLLVQLLDETGAALTLPARISRADVRAPFFAGRRDGSFAVVWLASRDIGNRSYNRGIWAQRFAGGGKPVEKPVNLVPGRDDLYRDHVHVAMGEDGTLALVAQESSPGRLAVVLRSFAPNGTALGPPAVLAVTDGSVNPSLPAGVAVDEQGRVLAVWFDPNGPAAHLLARVFDGGEPTGAAFVVGSSGDTTLLNACAAAAGSGGVWAVAWADWTPALNSSNLYLRRFGDD